MPKVTKIVIAVIAAISGASCLGCLIAAPSVFRYQPAVVAAPGHEMRCPTRPDLWTSVVKSYHRFLDFRTCD